MNLTVYSNFSIDFDKDKKMFVFNKNTINSIYEKLEPYCRKKRLNLVGVPEFVYKILEKVVYKHKPDLKKIEE